MENIKLSILLIIGSVSILPLASWILQKSIFDMIIKKCKSNNLILNTIFRAQFPRYVEMAAKYGELMDFTLVYIAEAHPFPNFGNKTEQHKTTADRVKVSRNYWTTEKLVKWFLLI